jgi:hypothetical protein
VLVEKKTPTFSFKIARREKRIADPGHSAEFFDLSDSYRQIYERPRYIDFSKDRGRDAEVISKHMGGVPKVKKRNPASSTGAEAYLKGIARKYEANANGWKLPEQQLIGKRRLRWE